MNVAENRKSWLLLALLAIVFIALALARPIDHDESQYVAAAALSAHGLLPYRDYAYFQTPLQPLLFAPVARAAGGWAWPALRIVNALLGAVVIGCVWRAARIGGASARTATLTCALLASCDILLFSIGTARNDALPAACLAAAQIPAMRACRGDATTASAMLAGLLLAAAAAAKLSYALPAIAYGTHALIDRRHRPLAVAIGAAPLVALLGWSAAIAPSGFLFGVFTFPTAAPTEYYAAAGQAWKLGYIAKTIDILKFLALGPALLGLLLTSRFHWKAKSGRAIDWMLIAGIIAALLPFPTWRQYLLPILPPLFVRLAIGWQARPPGSASRIALTVFVGAGLAPSIAAPATILPTPPMIEAIRQGAAIRAVMDEARVTGPVVTLSPQFLPATGRLPDPRFATGPFYFRSHTPLDPREDTDRLVSRMRLDTAFAVPPQAILTGGEGGWTSGDPQLDVVLERWAAGHAYRRVAIPATRFTLWFRPRAASPPPRERNAP